MTAPIAFGSRFPNERQPTQVREPASGCELSKDIGQRFESP